MKPLALALASIALGTFAAAQNTTNTPAEQPAQRRGTPGVTRPISAAVSRPAVARLTESSIVLPPLPDGVEELKFADFFKLPVGPKGLEPAERLQSLAGKKVRLVGYFVFEDWSTCGCPAPTAEEIKAKGRRALPGWMKHVVPGRALLAPTPVAVSLGHYGLSDDLPPQVAALKIASKVGEPVFYKPGIYAATGTLELANRDESDGRSFYVHLKIEDETQIVPLGKAGANAAAAQQAAAPSVAGQ